MTGNARHTDAERLTQPIQHPLLGHNAKLGALCGAIHHNTADRHRSALKQPQLHVTQLAYSLSHKTPVYRLNRRIAPAGMNSQSGAVL